MIKQVLRSERKGRRRWWAAVAMLGLLAAAPALTDSGVMSLDELKLRAVSLASYARQAMGYAIDPTDESLGLEPYLADIVIRPGQMVDLDRYLPVTLRDGRNPRQTTGLRVVIGDPGRDYELGLLAEDSVRVTLVDGVDRPVAQWPLANNEKVTVPGGTYRLKIEGSVDEALGGVSLSVTRHPEAARPEKSDLLPELALDMSPAVFANWDRARQDTIARAQALVAAGELTTSPTPDTRFTGFLKVDGEQRKVKVGLTGLANPLHWDFETPTFEVTVRAGQLIGGMSHIRLMSLRVDGGLVPHVVSSILQDEGVLMPRRRLVRMRLNGRDLGVYIAEEHHRSNGFFEHLRRYDGQLSSYNHFETRPNFIFLDRNAGWNAKPRLSGEVEYSPRMASLVEASQTAKTLALMTRFQANHGMQPTDFRLVRPILMDEMEPWTKDIGMGMSHPLHYLTWALAPALARGGPPQSPKFFPSQAKVAVAPDGFSDTPATLYTQSVHPLVVHFAHQPAMREELERALITAADPIFVSRFQTRMRQTLAAVQFYLKYERRDGLGVAEVLDQPLARQSSTPDFPFTADRAVTEIAENARLLVDVRPGPKRGDSEVSLYNLSAFSARLALPGWARVVTPGAGDYLAPSHFALTVMPGEAAGRLEDDVVVTPLLRRLERRSSGPILSVGTARRLIALEAVRPVPVDGTPLVKVRVPTAHLKEFLDQAKNGALIRSRAGLRQVPDAAALLVDELPNTLRTGVANTLHDTPLARLSDAAKFPLPNDSAFTVALKLRVGAIVAGTWMSVFDTGRRAGANCLLRVRPHPNGNRVFLDWYCGVADGLTIEAAMDEWVDVVVGADDRTKLYWVSAAGGSVFSGTFQGEAVAPQSVLTFKRVMEGSVPFVGTIADARLFDRPALPLANNAALPMADIVVLPLGQVPDADGTRLSYLVTNASARPLTVDPRRLRWTDAEGRAVPAVVLSVAAATGGKLSPGPLVLDAVGQSGTAAMPPPVYLWTGAAAGALAGSRQSIPNALVIEVRLGGVGYARIDAGDLLAKRAGEVGAVAMVLESPLFWRYGPTASEPGLGAVVGELDAATGVVDAGRPIDLGGVAVKVASVPGGVLEGAEAPSGQDWHVIRALDEDGRIPRRTERATWQLYPIEGAKQFRYFRIRPEPGRVIGGFLLFDPLNRPAMTAADLVAAGLFKRIEGNVLVPTKPDITLRAPAIIEGVPVMLPAGTRLTFGAEAGLMMRAPLHALGEPDRPVVFTPQDPARGFLGLVIARSPEPSLLRHVVLSGARGGFYGRHQVSGGVAIYHANAVLDGVDLGDLVSHDGLHISHSQFTLRNLNVHGTLDDALDVDWSYGELLDSHFADCGKGGGADCVDLSGSWVRVTNVVALRPRNKGFSIGEGAVVTMSGIHAMNAPIGVAVKDGSIATVQDCSINSATLGVALYIKKAIYGAPRAKLTNCRLTKVGRDMVVEPVNRVTRRYD